MKAVVIGLGLIGGSLALNLKQNKFISCVYGIDLNKEHLKEALELGLIHQEISFDNINKCDLIFLCTPVSAIISIIKELSMLNLSKNTSIIEFGSTKESIKKAIPSELKSQFILAHPMAGTENSGPKAAFKELFANAVCVLCIDKEVNNFHEHRIIELLSSLKMRLVFMDEKEHDHHSAIISHLPHIISFSLANYVLACEDKKHILNLAGGSFSDMSRIAKSSPLMWQNIFKENKENVLASLKNFKEELKKFEDFINNDDYEALFKWLQNANELRKIL